jgi:hypothetical protein
MAKPAGDEEIVRALAEASEEAKEDDVAADEDASSDYDDDDDNKETKIEESEAGRLSKEDVEFAFVLVIEVREYSFNEYFFAIKNIIERPAVCRAFDTLFGESNTAQVFVCNINPPGRGKTPRLEDEKTDRAERCVLRYYERAIERPHRYGVKTNFNKDTYEVARVMYVK